MAVKIRVQEYVHLSGRKYLSHAGFDDVPAALAELRRRVMRAKLEYNKYDAKTDTIINTSSVVTDDNEYIRIVNGRSVRTFTLVTARDRSPIPFGHLIWRGR